MADDFRRSGELPEDLYRALFETSPDAILVFDDAGRYVDVNESYCRLLQASREALIGRHFSEIIPADLVEAAKQALGQLMSAGSLAVEFPMRAADGTLIPLEWRSRSNIVPGLHVCIARDVSERKAAEDALRNAYQEIQISEEELRVQNEELLQMREAAEAANRAKDQFLATLSHELRTPLSPVLLLSSTLAEDPDVPPALRHSLAVIRRNVELEARLIDDLLDLTRIARGKLDLRMEVTDARKLIEHTVAIACEREIAAGRLRVRIQLAPGDHRLWADPSRLTQVLWNLLSNAVKFTPVGGVVTVRSSIGPDRLVLQVSDTGVGIDPDLLPHIFEAFEQGRIRSPRRTGGLGLGLAIGKAIVEMHGGTLTAASQGRGKGATFTLSLPRGRELPAAPEEPQEIQNPKSEIQNLRILLVEDHDDTAEAMAGLLALSGHQVTTARSVSQALAAAAERDGFDLVISDLGLPDGSGIDLMRELSAHHGLRGIALSGYGMEEDVRQSLEAGFARHLTKPVSLPQLQAALREIAGAGE
ncbi:MAG TPA: ATP-binding protein [Thermoanaerobaculia bacterium]